MECMPFGVEVCQLRGNPTNFSNRFFCCRCSILSQLQKQCPKEVLLFGCWPLSCIRVRWFGKRLGIHRACPQVFGLTSGSLRAFKGVTFVVYFRLSEMDFKLAFLRLNTTSAKSMCKILPGGDGFPCPMMAEPRIGHRILNNPEYVPQ